MTSNHKRAVGQIVLDFKGQIHSKDLETPQHMLILFTLVPDKTPDSTVVMQRLYSALFISVALGWKKHQRQASPSPS